MKTKVSFIGLGAMGLPMATSLVKANYNVTAFDLNPNSLKRFQTVGGLTADSAFEAATDADVLILMVLNAEQIDSVLFEQKLITTLASNAIIIVCSTVAPTYVQDLVKKLSVSAHQLIDAPVSGGVLGAEQQSLSIMASGPKDAFEKVAEILKTMGKNTHYLSEENSHGSAMKMINQLLAGVHIAAAAEALNLAQVYGLDTQTVQDIIKVSAGHSWMFADRGARILEENPEVKSSINIWLKDLAIVNEVAESLNVASPLSKTALSLFTRAAEQGYGQEDDSQVIKVLKKS